MQEKILSSWINCIDLESIEKAKLDVKSINTKTYFDLNNLTETVENIKLNFSKRPGLVNSLQAEFPIKKDHKGEDKNKLFLFFPLIRIGETQKEYLFPLFAIDVTQQKQALFSKKELALSMYKGADYIPMVEPFYRTEQKSVIALGQSVFLTPPT